MHIFVDNINNTLLHTNCNLVYVIIHIFERFIKHTYECFFKQYYSYYDINIYVNTS